jgi:hypothetical protein
MARLGTWDHVVGTSVQVVNRKFIQMVVRADRRLLRSNGALDRTGSIDIGDTANRILD